MSLRRVWCECEKWTPDLGRSGATPDFDNTFFYKLRKLFVPATQKEVASMLHVCEEKRGSGGLGGKMLDNLQLSGN